jgi:Tol biopolymer transport system component
MHFLYWLTREIILGVIITWCIIFSSFGQGSQSAPMQTHIIDPASKATVFAPGVISTPFDEGAATFAPDGKTVYFYQGTLYTTICYSTLVDGKWSKPDIVPISGQWSDWDPFLTPDGKRLFFVSSRPLENESSNKSKKKTHLWYADHLGGNKWSTPRPVDAPFNSDSVDNYAPSVSSSGTIFFCSRGRDGHAGTASYCAKWLGDHYDNPKLLALNGKEDTQDPFIAPDEHYIIFVSGNDLYVSFKQGNDWGACEKLGPQVNNGDAIWDPTVSPDGKVLYYTSARVQGFYKRDHNNPSLSYDDLLKEMGSIFNGKGNILMIPVSL